MFTMSFDLSAQGQRVGCRAPAQYARQAWFPLTALPAGLPGSPHATS